MRCWHCKGDCWQVAQNFALVLGWGWIGGGLDRYIVGAPLAGALYAKTKITKETDISNA